MSAFPARSGKSCGKQEIRYPLRQKHYSTKIHPICLPFGWYIRYDIGIKLVLTNAAEGCGVPLQ